MFEVVEIGSPERKRFFKRQNRPVKIRALKSTCCEQLKRTFEGYGNYSVQTYRADFFEGEVLTILAPVSEMISLGDQLSVESLVAQGQLSTRFRLVATQG